MNALDQMWLIICALFVFFMQAGFICFEVGFIQPKNVISVAIENIIAFVIATLSFFAVGYALMFGPTWHGLLGSDYWFGTHLNQPDSYIILLFELMFAGTAVTIFSGSLSERTKTKALTICAIVVGMIIYPVYGHWVWGDLYLKQPVFLKSLGFMDFAGATVVHATSGWVALAGLLVVGPRKDRWDANGSKKNLGRSNIPFAALGTFILWFSWFGFNGGSLLHFDHRIGLILINTNIAATAGVLGAVGTVFLFQKNQNFMEAIFSGALGALVAITASSNLVTPRHAFLIGFITGAVVVFASAFLERLKIDDAVGAVPIHAFGGVCGTLLLPFFASPKALLAGSRLNQFLAQSLGVGVNFIWAFGMGYLAFKVIDRLFGLRVTPEEEEKGLNIVEFSDVYTWQQTIKEQSYVTLTEDLYRHIQNQNLTLNRQSQMLIATQEQEREKIARDLHDGVGQLLAASKIDLGILKRSLQTTSQQDQVSRILKLLDQTVEEIRGVIFNLKPVQLEHQGLERSIERLAFQLQKISGVAIVINAHQSLPVLDETITLNLFRIVQECLNNAVKHANAQQITLAYRINDAQMILTISDDGQGFNLDNTPLGIGMTTIRERAILIGADLHMVSSAQQGTLITLEIPYGKN